MRLLTFALLSLLLAACGDDPRRCIERAECFAGEYCERGKCAPYKGKTTTKPAPDHDMGGVIE